MVVNGIVNTISAISWRKVLLVEATGVPEETPPTCRKSGTVNIIYGCIEYTLPDRNSNSQR